MSPLKAAWPNGDVDGMPPLAANGLASPRGISLAVGVARPTPDRKAPTCPPRGLGCPARLVAVRPAASPKTPAAEIGTGPLGPQIGAPYAARVVYGPRVARCFLRPQDAVVAGTAVPPTA